VRRHALYIFIFEFRGIPNFGLSKDRTRPTTNQLFLKQIAFKPLLESLLKWHFQGQKQLFKPQAL
jgi:hypothetical protein